MAYVYPPEMRASRDLLRRRMYLMRKRSELLAHVQNTNSQYNLPEIGKKIAYKANRQGVAERFSDPSVQRSIEVALTDEAGVRSDQVLGRTWGLRGQTPEVAPSGRRQSVSAISAVNARGAFWYEIYTERLNASRFLELLKDFMRGRKGPLFLVLDGHPAHIA